MMQSGQRELQSDQGMQADRWEKDKSKKHMQSSMSMGEDHMAVKAAILHEMVSRGYELDPNNPDLLVSYQIFKEKGEAQGFSDDEDMTGMAGTALPEPIEVDAGTLMISISDAESGEMISRGFMPGALSDAKTSGPAGTQSQNMEKPGMADKAMNAHVLAIKAVSGIFDEFEIAETAAIGEER